jgi:hypothetical protein
MRRVIRLSLDACPEALYIVGGPQPDDPFWQQLITQSRGRVRVVGLLSRNALRQWFAAADVYIDSVPLGGGMTCLDAAQSGLPVVTHDIYRQAVSFIRCSGWEFSTTQKLVQGVLSLVGSVSLREEVVGVQNALIMKECSPALWAGRVRDCLDRCREHSVTRDWPCFAALDDYQVFMNCIVEH